MNLPLSTVEPTSELYTFFMTKARFLGELLDCRLGVFVQHFRADSPAFVVLEDRLQEAFPVDGIELNAASDLFPETRLWISAE